MPFSPHHVKGTYRQLGLLLLMLALITCLSVKLLPHKATPTPFHIILFDRKVTEHSSHLRGWGLCSLSLRAEYGHQLFRILLLRRFVFPPFIHSSTPSLPHSFISVWTPGSSEFIFRKRQEGVLLLLVHVQRPGKTEAADVDTGQSPASLWLRGSPHTPVSRPTVELAAVI